MMTELQKTAVASLVAVARAAWVLLDGTEDAGETSMKVDNDDWQKLSDAMDQLDTLPEDLDPNVVMQGPAKAEFILGQIDPTPELEKERAVRMIVELGPDNSTQTIMLSLQEAGFDIIKVGSEG